MAKRELVLVRWEKGNFSARPKTIMATVEVNDKGQFRGHIYFRKEIDGETNSGGEIVGTLGTGEVEVHQHLTGWSGEYTIRYLLTNNTDGYFGTYECVRGELEDTSGAAMLVVLPEGVPVRRE